MIELTIQYDPTKEFTMNLLTPIAYVQLARYEEAKALSRPYIEKLLEMDSTNLRYLEIAGELYSYFDPVLSRKNYKKVIQSRSFDPRINFFAGVGIGYFLWEEGENDSANVWLDEVFDQLNQLIQEGSEDLNNYMILASIHSIRKENKEAISLLERVPRTSMDYVSWLRSPMSESLSRDPDFINLIEEERKIIQGMRESVVRDEKEKERLKG